MQETYLGKIKMIYIDNKATILMRFNFPLAIGQGWLKWVEKIKSINIVSFHNNFQSIPH